MANHEQTPVPIKTKDQRDSLVRKLESMSNDPEVLKRAEEAQRKNDQAVWEYIINH